MDDEFDFSVARAAQIEPAADAATLDGSDHHEPEPPPATPTKVPITIALSARIDASNGHAAGSASAGTVSVVDNP